MSGKLLLLFFVVAINSKVYPQGYGEIGIFGGGSYYLGDLNPGKQFLMTQPAFGAFVRHNFNERLAIKGAFSLAMVQGDDQVSGYVPDRNLNFKSNITDISVQFEFNLFEYFIGSLRNYFTPYMFAGAGVTLFNPISLTNDVELRPLGTEGQNEVNSDGEKLYPEREYGRIAVNIPFGIGFKYSINDRLGLSLHWAMHKAFTDYLDDVSTNYYLEGTDWSSDSNPPVYVIASDPTLSHSPHMQRGNPEHNDWYSMAGVSLSIKINYGGHKKCLNTFL